MKTRAYSKFASFARARPSAMDSYRVCSGFLPPEKCWYVLHTGLFGIAPTKVKTQSIFSILNEEIKSVPVNQLFDFQGNSLSESKWFRRHCKSTDGHVMVISTLGVIASILKHRDPRLLTASQFHQLLEKINGEDIGATKHRSTCCNSTMVHDLDDQLNSTAAAQLQALEDNLESSRKRLEVLQSEINEYRDTPGYISDSNSSESCAEIQASTKLNSKTKKRLISKTSGRIFRSFKDVSEKHRETVASVLGHAVAFNADPDATDVLSEIVDIVVEHKGIRAAVEKKIFSEKTYAAFLQTMRVPDWVLLYFKLAARIPDESWQTILNLTRLGDTGVSLLTSIKLTFSNVHVHVSDTVFVFFWEIN